MEKGAPRLFTRRLAGHHKIRACMDDRLFEYLRYPWPSDRRNCVGYAIRELTSEPSMRTTNSKICSIIRLIRSRR